MAGTENTSKEKLLINALDRLIRFNRALIQMGAVETRTALEAELDIAFKISWDAKD